MLQRVWAWLKMALAKLSLRLTVNPDGTGDTAFPSGDKPPGPATASWGDLTALSALIAQRTTGTSFSHDIRQYLTGTASSTAVLSVTPTSGGWSIVGNNLTNDGGVVGAGFFRLGATVGVNAVLSNPLSWSWSNPVADTLPPTVPTGLTGTTGAGQIVWTWDAASDAFDSGVASAGVKEYDLELNGAITVVPGAQGLTGALTATAIGSYLPVASAMQSGKNWTLTSAGAGIDSTADQCLFVGRQVSGDGFIIAKIHSMSGIGTSFAPGGLMIRESLAVGAKYVALYQWLTAQSQGVQGKYRINTDGARANLATVTGTNTPRWLKLTRAGDLFTLLYSTDGRSWTPHSTQSVPMGPAVQVGAFASSNLAGSAVIVAVHELNINTEAALTYSQPTALDSTARVRSRDLVGNVSAYSPLSDPVTPTGTVPLIKWHPGHYVRSDVGQTTATLVAADLAAVNSSAAVKGLVVHYNWVDLEPTRDNYQPGIDRINGHLAQLPSTKRLILKIRDRSFGTVPVQFILPPYLASEPGGGGGWIAKPNNTGFLAKIWLAPIMDRLIALHRALALAFDTHPRVELVVVVEESSPGNGVNSTDFPDYSRTAYATQLKRCATAAAQNWTHTNLVASSNFLSGEISGLIAHYNSVSVGHGGPDVPPPPHAETTAGQVWRGLATDPSGGTPISYLESAPCAYVAASTPYTTTGAKDTKPGGAGYTAQEFFDHAYNALHVNYLMWVRRESGSAPWTSGISPVIAANPTLRETPPSRYNGQVDTT
jgi:hypothetical protein